MDPIIVDAQSEEPCDEAILEKRMHVDQLRQLPHWSEMETDVEIMAYRQVLAEELDDLEKEMNESLDECGQLEDDVRHDEYPEEVKKDLLHRLQVLRKDVKTIRKRMYRIRDLMASHPEQLADVPLGLGYCHVIWGLKKQFFKEKYDIDWYSPDELFPDVLFD